MENFTVTSSSQAEVPLAGEGSWIGWIFHIGAVGAFVVTVVTQFAAAAGKELLR